MLVHLRLGLMSHRAADAMAMHRSRNDSRHVGRFRRVMRRCLGAFWLVSGGCGSQAVRSSSPVSVPETLAVHSVAPIASAETTPAEPAPRVCPPRRAIGTAEVVPGAHTLLTSCRGARDSCGGSSEPGGLGDDHFVDVWELEEGGLTRSLDAGLSSVSLSFAPNHRVATIADPTTGAGEVRVFDTTTWKLLAKTEAYCIQSVLFDDAGERLAVAGADGRIVAFDTESWRPTERPIQDAHIGGDVGVRLSFDPTGKSLLVLDDAAGPQLLDAKTLTKKPARRSTWAAPSLAMSPSREWAAAVHGDGELDVLDTRSLIATRRAKRDSLAGASVEPIDTERFVVLETSGDLSLWSAKGNKPPQSLGAPSKADHFPTAIAVDPTRPAVALVSASGEIHLWDLRGAPSERQLAPAGSEVAATAPVARFNTKGDHLAVLDAAGALTIWDVSKSHRIAELAPSGPVDPNEASATMNWSSDGAFLVETTHDEARVVRTTDGASVTLQVFERDRRRIGVVHTGDGTYAGPPALAACATGRDAALTTQRPTLLEDFALGRPLR